MTRLCVLFTLAYCYLLPPVLAQEPADKVSGLAAVIEPLVKAHAGDVAVSVRHLETGEKFEINGDRAQGTASLIKLPIMIEAYRQAIDESKGLQRMLDLRKEDMVEGSGILTSHFSPGMRLSMRDALRLMIAFSDNTATNLVLDQIGLEATAKTMAKLGYPETRVHAKVFKRATSIAPERSERYGLGSTTANDMVDILARVHAGTIVSPGTCKDMLQHLAACDDKIKFPAGLPPGTKIYHKTGSVAKVRTDAGIIETKAGAYALCVLTENNEDTRWSSDNAGDRLCADIAKATFEYFTSELKPSAAPDGLALAKGATGDMVEALQRTLNARMAPSPKLGVDGDFGAGTEAAVKIFQTSKKLEATGTVDAKTWSALGSLVMEDTPVPDPEVINAEQLTKEPADDPFGQPAVTCKAWVIADATTGEKLWGSKSDVPLDIASTTKIMTAYLVLRYCQAKPDALDEVIVFSRRADKTNGSTSALRAGESVRVGDLLYGLMLPSGNDASVAFAEHFGSRLYNKEPELENHDAFIKAMNAAAAELDMQQSHFINPHGLTAEGHKSSCDDLVKLTLAARQLELFRTITTCRQYGCRVSGEGGYQRNVKWENTNLLLPIEGYAGVKTGTTDAAGACLVSVGKYKERELVVVVLGSVASPARYSDARNLYAWAWRKLTMPELFKVIDELKATK